MVTLDLPYAPSINHYYSYYQGRPILSKDARTFRQKVRAIARSWGIKPQMGPLAVKIEIYPPDERRRDCDNVQKAVIDALQHAGAFWDDSQIVWLLSLKRQAKPSGLIRVTIRPADSEHTVELEEAGV